MKNIFKYALTMIMTVTSCYTAYAQETEDYEDMVFEPIHATISPGNGTLGIEEVYGKKSMIATNGDALLIKSGNESIKTNTFELPLNAMEDYTMEFTFVLPKFGGWVTMNFSGYSIMFSKKMADAQAMDSMDNNPAAGMNIDSSFLKTAFGKNPQKKFKMPAGKEKDQVICKIVKRKKIVTVFLNGQYVAEFNVKPMHPILKLNIDFTFKTEGVLQSIRLDQGPEEDSDD